MLPPAGLASVPVISRLQSGLQFPYSLPPPAARRNSCIPESGQCVTLTPSSVLARLQCCPTSLCLLALPHSTPRLSLQISAFCSLVPLAYFLVPSQIAASFSPSSSVSPHCSRGRHLPSKAVLLCPLPAKCSSAPTLQIPIPSVSLARLHGPFCCGRRTCFRGGPSCSSPACSPGLCTLYRKKFCVIYLQLKIVPSTFNVVGKYKEMALRESDLTQV